MTLFGVLAVFADQWVAPAAAAMLGIDPVAVHAVIVAFVLYGVTYRWDFFIALVLGTIAGPQPGRRESDRGRVESSPGEVVPA